MVRKRSYLVFDRDGTLIEYVPYLTNKSQVKFIPGVLETLKALKVRGYRFGIATNQSVIGRGLASRSEVDEINSDIVNEIELSIGVRMDFVKVCPHLPTDLCICRKPNPGLLLKEIHRFNIDCANSFMIGDSEIDIEFGFNLGMHTVLINSPRISTPKSQADYFVNSFPSILSFL